MILRKRRKSDQVLPVKCTFRARYPTERARAIADIKNGLYNMGLLSGMVQSTFSGDTRGVDAAAVRIRSAAAHYLQTLAEYPNVRSLWEGAFDEIIDDYRAAAERNRHG